MDGEKWMEIGRSSVAGRIKVKAGVSERLKDGFWRERIRIKTLASTDNSHLKHQITRRRKQLLTEKYLEMGT